MRLPDLKASLIMDVSLYPGQRTSGSVGAILGDWVDLENSVGPVYGLFVNGVASGSGTFSQAHICKLQEADDNSGTGVQDVDGSAVSLSADKDCAIFRGIRTKRYVRAVLTTGFVGGTTAPVNDLSAAVFAEARSF